ncbi:MAG TPA: SDR family oxidoreductase [Candidatus Elarobacter sp.]
MTFPAQKTVLVAGGAGGVGEGIVRALLLATDVRVVVTSRSAARLALLEERLADAAGCGRLIGIVGNAGDPAGADAIGERIRADVGALQVAIPSLGGWWEGGPLLSAGLATWEAVMSEMLTTHFVFARRFVPELEREPGGWYLAIGGGAAFYPVPSSGIVSIAAAAQVMLTRTLAREHTANGIRINELVVNGPVRTRDSEAISAPDWITADEVGGVVADLIRDGTTSWPRWREQGPLLIMDPVR